MIVDYVSKINKDELESMSDELMMLDGSNYSHLTVAHSMWLDQMGGVSVAGIDAFGKGEEGNASFSRKMWKAFIKEWQELICGDGDKYEELHEKISSVSEKSSSVVVSLISAQIAVNLGLENGGVVAPFVVILLHGVLKMGRNAFCVAIREE